MNNYWHIVLYDPVNEVVKVKPENVAYVQNCIKNKEHINTPERTIMIGNIKDFLPTDIPVVDKAKMLERGVGEDVAQAFNEPIHNEDGSVVSRAVKKLVPHRKWETFYSANPAYKKLSETDGGVWVGFMLPVHLIREGVFDCTKSESVYVEPLANKE